MSRQRVLAALGLVALLNAPAVQADSCTECVRDDPYAFSDCQNEEHEHAPPVQLGDVALVETPAASPAVRLGTAWDGG